MTCGNDFTIIKGETFIKSGIAGLHEALCSGRLEVLSSTPGEFCFIHYSHRTGNVYFGVDRLGRQSLFYYVRGKLLAVSDDFWELAEYISVGLSNVDPQSVKEFVGLNYPLFYGTFIKDLYFMPPATYACYSSSSGELRLTQYWDIRYSPDYSISLSDAVEQMDAALDETFKQIKALNPYASYGVGLSGGLDSRLIPHYALKNDMPIRSFIIGESRPHKIFLSRDHSSARKIAQFYRIHHVEVEWNWDSFEKKMSRDVRRFPMGASQFFITVSNGVPTFDVLLTGASGMIVGSEIPNTVVSMSRNELLRAIISHCSLIGKSSGFIPKAIRGIREIIGVSGPAQKNTIDRLKDFFSREEFDIVMDKFSSFVTSEFAKGKTNLDVFQTYFVFFLGSRNRLGAFESLQGLRKAYSIYTSAVLDASLKWPSEYLLDRVVLKETIKRIVPGVADIEAQDHRPPIVSGVRSGLGIRMLSMVKYLVRGAGVGRHEIWAKRRDYRRFAHSILRRPNPLFHSLFDHDRMQSFLRDNPRLFEKLVKAKVILDLIDSGDYKKLCALEPEPKEALTVWTL
ncbi:MAG: hypothetical protein IMF26_04565 [Candidatus Fermentithermobacillus carboniphilus]|uniref:asparagine synthase (glutamine-hydrolyzing) n=1 Tax=Candidatus Fermentithermobacillus carboniphilus TaxID=3085328 RepID=A0AAT9LE90_9FIRM|nr:MAG: hypothetical protein IMF26_04565 [Candidatus Fermentithermobacillus carboniphilus]